jgi:hypothetical protein
MAQILSNAMPSIQRLLESTDPPAMFTISRGGTIKKLDI